MAQFRRFTLTPAVPLDAVAEGLRDRVKPDAPKPARMMAAKALLPADPPDLVTILSYLGGDSDPTLADAARGSLETLPDNLLLPALARPLHAEVLSFCAKLFLSKNKAIEAIALNARTSDEAIAFIGSNGDGPVLEIIATNQVRVLRHADIAEALYFNPNTPASAATRVMETAVRGGLDLSHIPGYREIAQSILGEGGGGPGAGAEAPAAREAAADSIPEAAAMEALGADTAFEAFLQISRSEEASEDLFDQLLRIASTAREEDEEVLADMTEARSKKALWKLVREMNVPQRVRLALMGNVTARQLLIRDSKRVVAMAVMRSPGLSDKEIIGFAQNRSIGDDIIRLIAYQREWTKNYAVRHALTMNPKTPPAKAISFLNTLRERDVKLLAKDRDVPNYISRAAKRHIEQKEERLRAGHSR
jgi:hypothetical protein